MPEIKNTTLKTEWTKIAKVLKERNQNINAEHVASVIVRTVLEELGAKEYLTDEMKAERVELVALIKPMITAAKNYQTSYLAATKGEDGEPLMPKAETKEVTTEAEFA